MEIVSTEEDLFDDLSGKEMRSKLHKAMETHLTQREREIVALRYGLGGLKPLPQREIAAQYGISRSYISRIEKKALQKLEQALSGCRQRFRPCRPGCSRSLHDPALPSGQKAP